MNGEYIIAKINDYKEINYLEKLKKTIDELDDIVRDKEFKNEMSRFIPADVIERTLQKEKFVNFLINEDKSLLLQVEKIVDKS